MYDITDQICIWVYLFMRQYNKTVGYASLMNMPVVVVQVQNSIFSL